MLSQLVFTFPTASGSQSGSRPLHLGADGTAVKAVNTCRPTLPANMRGTSTWLRSHAQVPHTCVCARTSRSRPTKLASQCRSKTKSRACAAAAAADTVSGWPSQKPAIRLWL
jgi:hypothetical protein